MRARTQPKEHPADGTPGRRRRTAPGCASRCSRPTLSPRSEHAVAHAIGESSSRVLLRMRGRVAPFQPREVPAATADITHTFFEVARSELATYDDFLLVCLEGDS